VPVFLLMPQLGTVETIIWTAFKLFVTIGASTLAAMVVRRFLLPDLSANARQSLDGVSAIVLAVFVVGLMEAAARVLFSDPLAMLGWLVFACAANFGMQLAAYFALGRSMLPEARTAVSIVAGNRNIALFLVSLPPDVTAPLLVFIGCYQIPMYLTPLVMRPLYRGPH
jgi:ACR3 family arsenite transporter